MLTQQRLRELLHYDPATGEWTWIKSRPGVRAGSHPSYVNSRGYAKIKIDRRSYYAHRLAFLYMTGHWPADQADHADVNPGANEWLNIREATQTQNNANRRRQKNNSSGYKGVSRCGSAWRAMIAVSGKRISLGRFSTAAAAHAAYMVAATNHFCQFARAA